jgi:RHS repeat-associated protein
VLPPAQLRYLFFPLVVFVFTGQLEANVSRHLPRPLPTQQSARPLKAIDLADPSEGIVSYDDLNRLKTVTYPADASFPQGRKVEYGYDAVGNRTSETTTNAATGAPIESKTASFDALNRLERVTHSDPAQTVAFDYDRNGNQTKKTVGPETASPLVTEYGYDVRDMLVEASQGGSILSRFQYDFDGRRTLKVGEGLPGDNVRQYVYDQTSLLLEYDAGGAQVAKYDYGSDRLISLFRRDEPRRYFSFDGLRSVTNLTADDGSTVASYHLDAWGNYRFPSELEASKNRWGFTGYQWDPETGLFNAKARYFDPQLGRFLSQDTFTGNIDDPPSLHRFYYGRANPLRYVDPTGHENEAANPAVSEEIIRQWEEYGKQHPVDVPPTTVAQPTAEVPEGTVQEEGLLASAWRWYSNKKEAAKRWVRDHTGALGRKLFSPSSNTAREQEIQQAFQGTATAESAATDYNRKRKIGEGVQQVSGDVGAATGDLATEAAFQYAEGRVAGGIVGAIARGAGRGRQALRNAAKDADEAIEAEVQANRRAAAAEARAAGRADEPAAFGGGPPRGGGPIPPGGGGGPAASGGPRALLPGVSASTEAEMARLIADSNPRFPLTRENALRAVRGPQGATTHVAGRGGSGSDILFKGPGSGVLRREVKSIAGGAQGTFNTEVAKGARQVGYQGEVLVQMPEGTDAVRKVLGFRGSRPTPADLGVYRSIDITIVDPSGKVLYSGPLVP